MSIPGSCSEFTEGHQSTNIREYFSCELCKFSMHLRKKPFLKEEKIYSNTDDGLHKTAWPVKYSFFSNKLLDLCVYSVFLTNVFLKQFDKYSSNILTNPF